MTIAIVSGALSGLICSCFGKLEILFDDTENFSNVKLPEYEIDEDEG